MQGGGLMHQQSNPTAQWWRTSILVALIVWGVCAMALPVGAVAPPAEWWVDPAGDDALNDCRSAATPCKTIGGAIGKAAGGDTIHVATGTYAEHLTVDKALTFAGAGAANTIVDGTSNGRIFDVTAAVTMQDLALRNGWVSGSNIGAALRTTAPLTLTRVVVANSTAYYGGGVAAAADVNVSNSRFEDNVATGPNINNTVRNGGGGLYVTGNLVVADTHFLRNRSAGTGGGISLRGNATITGGSFVDNATTYAAAGSGAAIGINGTLFMSGTQVIRNTGGQSGGAVIAGDGEAATGGDTTVINVLFQENSSTVKSGGALYTYGNLVATNTQFLTNTAYTKKGAVSVAGGASISGSLFQGNTTAGYDGAIGVSGNLEISDSQFYSNTAATFAGALEAVGPEAIISNCRFEGNRAGTFGGAFVTNSAVTMTGSQFINNRSNGRAGAMLTDYGTVAISNTHFAGNSAGDYGGAYVSTGSLVLTNSDFLTNTASGDAGALNVEGAATLTDVLLEGNHAGGKGGALLNYYAIAELHNVTVRSNQAGSGGGVYNLGGSLQVFTSTMSSNTAANGGGIYSTDPGGALAVYASTITANTASGSGGGFYSGNSAVVNLMNSRVEGNTGATGGGGVVEEAQVAGMRFLNNQATGDGGGLAIIGGPTQVINTVFAGNGAANNGAAVQVNAPSAAVAIVQTTIASATLATGKGIYVANGTVNIVDTIVASQTVGIQRTGGTVTADYNLYFDAPTSVITGTHSITGSDPRFMDPAGGDFRVQDGSPALGAGVDAGATTDIDGNLRGNPPTIGAYEFPYVPQPKDAYLIDLQVQGAVLNHRFVATMFGYTSTVRNRVDTTVVTPTASAAGATITVNGAPVASGSSSDPINLAIGANPITTVVTSADSTTVHTYTAVITRRVYDGPFYVDKTVGDDGNLCDGWSAGHACKTITGAIGKSVLPDTYIFISGHTYTENLTVGLPLNFVGVGADSTIIDGRQLGRVFNITGIPDLVTFQDLTVQNGRITSGSGAGIFASGMLSLTNVNVLSNTVSATSGNAFGGGVYATGDLAVAGGVFRNNLADTALATGTASGGAVYANGPARVAGAQIISNTANAYRDNPTSYSYCYGGGLYAAGVIALSDSTFTNNFIKCTDNGQGGGLYTSGEATVSGGRFEGKALETTLVNWYNIVAGGGMYAQGTSVITGTQFMRNRTKSAFPYAGLGAGFYAAADTQITGALFQENNAQGMGGGFGAENVSALITGTQFLSNTAGFGGGLGIFVGTGTVFNSTFVANSAANNGGAVFLQSYGGSGNGRFINDLFIRNDANDGAVLFNQDFYGISNILFQYATIVSPAGSTKVGIRGGSSNSLRVEDSILNGYGTSINSDNGNVSSDYNLFYNAPMSEDPGPHSLLEVDPKFLDPQNDDYRLMTGSPAVNAGVAIPDVTFDLMGKGRSVLPTLGAYEAAVDIDLTNLVLSSGALTPSFARGTTSYTGRAANIVTSATVTPTASNPSATITVNGVTVASGTQSPAIPLVVGANPITVTVTSADGTARKSYIVVVTRTGADLLNLVLSSGPLTPAFGRNTTSYTATVPNLVRTVILTPTAADSSAIITVNGEPAISGAPFGPIPLVVGTTTITTVVRADDNSAVKTYYVAITRPPSNDANLRNLGLTVGTLTPSFISTTVSYASAVANGIATIGVIPTANEENARITVNGNPTTSGSPSAPIALAVGDNLLTTEVVAQDGTVTTTYAITVTRAPLSLVNAQLSALTPSTGTLAPSFAPAVLTYAFAVPYTVTNVSITPIASELTSTLAVNGVPIVSGAASQPISLAAGTVTTATTVVTAPNGINTLTYRVLITREPWKGPFYVAPTGSDSNQCESWAYACKTVKHAIEKSVLTDTIIYISGDKFTENLTVPLPIHFVGSDAASTIIDGGGIGRVFNITTTAGAVTFQDLTVQNGTMADHGGGIYAAGSISLTNVNVMTNTVNAAGKHGGGVYATGPLTLTNVTMQNNRTSGTNAFGGGVYANNISLITSARFIGNQATVSGGGLYVTTEGTTISNTQFLTNTNVGWPGRTGGGAFFSGGKIVLTNSLFQGNSSNSGGGCYVNKAGGDNSLTVNGVRYVGNSAGNGGAIYDNGSNASVTNVLFDSNSADYGSALYMQGYTSGGTLLNSATVLFSTFVQATAGSPSAIYHSSAVMTVKDSIFSNHVKAFGYSGDTTSDYNLFYAIDPGVVTGTHSISGSNPLFYNATAGNYRLQDGSPAIGAGLTNASVTTDLDGNARLTPPTMGAYEDAYYPYDVNLINLTLSNGTLTPAFGPRVRYYTARVAGNVGSITASPTASNPAVTIMVNGSQVASGGTSQLIPLASGPNLITTTVVATDTVTTKSYVVTVTRTWADLANLVLSSGPLTPVFAPATTSYTATVPNLVKSVIVTPTVADATATVTVNGVAVPSGRPSGAIALNVGPNTITTLVTGVDGFTTKSYTVIVTRLPSSDANLINLALSVGALSPSFISNTVSYAASVPNGITSIAVQPTSNEPNATIAVMSDPVTSGAFSAPIPLSIGANPITTVVTAQDGTTIKQYVVTVTRAPAVYTDATLANLAPSSGAIAPVFTAATISYTASVPYTVTSVTVTPTASQLTATLTLNGAPISSGYASSPINLAVGGTTVTTVIRSPDGANVVTYTLTMIRLPWTGPFYVDPQTGNDANACEAWGAGSACQTIGGAIAKTTLAGTYIYIAPGFFAENLTSTVPINVVGAGITSTVVDGGQVGRVFNITAATGVSSFRDLTIQNGRFAGNGAGINAAAALTLTNVNVISNTISTNATVRGGGAYAGGAVLVTGSTFQGNVIALTGSAQAFGGGLYAGGALTLVDSQFIANRCTATAYSSNGGGGIFANSTTVMTSTQFIGNTANYGDGGGIYANAQTSVSGSLFQENLVDANNPSTDVSRRAGGGLLVRNGVATIVGSKFISNTAWAGAGAAIYGVTATLTDTKFIANRGIQDGGGLLINSGTSTPVQGANLLFDRNSANYGAALYMVNIESSPASFNYMTVVSPTVLAKPAIYKGSGGTLTIRNSIVASYTASYQKGGGVIS